MSEQEELTEEGSDSHVRKDIGSMIAVWKHVEDEHKQRQLINPFSEWEGATHRERLSKDDENYARPVEGSMTAIRGRMAGDRISGEVQMLIDNIRLLGETNRDGQCAVRFGKLFDHYVRVSNKLVGILMRARKQGLVHFEGEMLWQRRDDHVVITLTV